ncbi:hypothetical protein OG216_09650 [Streptomycetaceae bacterium NBC_01309]
MRVVVNEDMKVFHGHVPVELKAGQEVSGSLAEMLAASAARKVTRVDVESPPAEPPAELDINAVAADVLAWVGDDQARAAEALKAENAKGETARSTLTKALEKIAAT